jgi:hypothetical protein
MVVPSMSISSHHVPILIYCCRVLSKASGHNQHSLTMDLFLPTTNFTLVRESLLVWGHVTVVSTWISLIVVLSIFSYSYWSLHSYSGAKYILILLLGAYRSSLEKCTFRSFAHLLIKFFDVVDTVVMFVLLCFRGFLFVLLYCMPKYPINILYINLISGNWFAKYFSHSTVCLFIFLMFSCLEQRLTKV